MHMEFLFISYMSYFPVPNTEQCSTKHPIILDFLYKVSFNFSLHDWLECANYNLQQSILRE